MNKHTFLSIFPLALLFLGHSNFAQAHSPLSKLNPIIMQACSTLPGGGCLDPAAAFNNCLKIRHPDIYQFIKTSFQEGKLYSSSGSTDVSFELYTYDIKKNVSSRVDRPMIHWDRKATPTSDVQCFSKIEGEDNINLLIQEAIRTDQIYFLDKLANLFDRLRQNEEQITTVLMTFFELKRNLKEFKDTNKHWLDVKNKIYMDELAVHEKNLNDHFTQQIMKLGIPIAFIGSDIFYATLEKFYRLRHDKAQFLGMALNLHVKTTKHKENLINMMRPSQRVFTDDDVRLRYNALESLSNTPHFPLNTITFYKQVMTS